MRRKQQPQRGSTRKVGRAAVALNVDALPFYCENNVAILNEDFLEDQSLPASSIDLIVTSPPYNVDISYGSHNDKLTYEDYLEFTRKWVTKCYALAKDDGRLCLNIPLDKNKGGQQSVYADITRVAKKVGWKYHTTIIWNEQNISRRTAWGSWRSASAPFIITPVEMILVLYKHGWKKHSGSRISTISKAEFMGWTNGVWSFGGESKKRIGHPAPYPVELPRRCIKLFSFAGDTILDPFLGSGTTLVACMREGRTGVGIDIDRRYCALAKRRIKEEASRDGVKGRHERYKA
jgi:site-specific DNA-methyltransferase (adenine-specific)